MNFNIILIASLFFTYAIHASQEAKKQIVPAQKEYKVIAVSEQCCTRWSILESGEVGCIRTPAAQKDNKDVLHINCLWKSAQKLNVSPTLYEKVNIYAVLLLANERMNPNILLTNTPKTPPTQSTHIQNSDKKDGTMNLYD